MSILPQSEHWRDRAREAREDATDDLMVRHSMLRLAESYEFLAKDAEEAAAALDKMPDG